MKARALRRRQVHGIGLVTDHGQRQWGDHDYVLRGVQMAVESRQQLQPVLVDRQHALHHGRTSQGAQPNGVQEGPEGPVQRDYVVLQSAP